MAKSRRIQRVRRKHLKEVGVKPKTITRYHNQIRKFFRWCRLYYQALPRDPHEFDDRVAEYLNIMWLEGDSHSYAGDLLSGIGRFLPRAKRHLCISRQYFKNWSRVLHRRRAVPFPLLLVQGMIGVALLRRREDLSGLLAAGFKGFLRTQEMVELRPQQLFFGPQGDVVIITWEDTKTTTRKNAGEQVVIKDRLVVTALRKAVQGVPPQKPIYRNSPGKFGEELRWLAELLGISAARFTPYGIRRGGATWFYMQTGSLDRTTLRGRWNDPRTARIYIDGAAAEWAKWQVETAHNSLIQRAANLGMRLLAEANNNYA